MDWREDMNDGTVRRTDVLRASPPMFESRILDALSRVHPAVPILIFLPAIALLFAWGLSLTSVPLAIGLFALGYAIWSAVRVLAAPPRLPLRARGRDSARASTGSSTASTTTTRTTRCGSSCRRR